MYIRDLIRVAFGPQVGDSVPNCLDHKKGKRSLSGPFHTKGGPFCGTKGYEFVLSDFQTELVSLGSEVREMVSHEGQWQRLPLPHG